MPACTCTAGTLPPSFSNLTQLSTVTFADNLLTGDCRVSAPSGIVKVPMTYRE